MSDLRGAGDDFHPLFALGEPPLRCARVRSEPYALAEYAERAVKSLPCA